MFTLKDLDQLHYFLGFEVTWINYNSLHSSNISKIFFSIPTYSILSLNQLPWFPPYLSLLMTLFRLTILLFITSSLDLYNILLSLGLTSPSPSIKSINTCTNHIIRYLAGNATRGIHL